MNNCSRFMSDMSTIFFLFVAGVWTLVSILLYAWSEWQAWHGFVYTSFFYGLFFITMCLFCIVASIYCLIKKKLAHAAMYIMIIVVTVLALRNITPLEMMVKAYFFSVYPQLCPVKQHHAQNSFICYEYNENTIGGLTEILVLDHSDSMRLPPSQWPQEIKNIFGFTNNEKRIPDDDCRFRNTRYMINHIFWISYDCWESGQ